MQLNDNRILIKVQYNNIIFLNKTGTQKELAVLHPDLNALKEIIFICTFLDLSKV